MDRLKNFKKMFLILVLSGLLMLLLAGSSIASQPARINDSGLLDSQNSDGPAFEAIKAPGTAILISPTGTLATSKPTYIWNKAENTQFYCLQVNDSLGNIVIEQWFDAASFLGATCSATPPDTLAPGSYSWRIQTWDCTGDSWSNALTFDICSTSSIPGVASLISPIGTIGTSKPTYTWYPVTGSTQYRLKVVNIIDPNVPIIDQWNDSAQVQSGTKCAITPNVTLGEGSYSWGIQTRNCKGDGPWSTFMSFKFAIISPGTARLISPSGLISTSTPTYTWTAVLGASKYHLQVANLTSDIIDIWFDAPEVTSGSRCKAFLPHPLQDDDGIYFWRIQAANEASVTGPWSGYKYFETVCSSSKSKAIARAEERKAVNSMKKVAIMRAKRPSSA